MSYLHLFIAELKRRWSLVLAYPVEEIVETIRAGGFLLSDLSRCRLHGWTRCPVRQSARECDRRLCCVDSAYEYILEHRSQCGG